jgi:hypothetical protein
MMKVTRIRTKYTGATNRRGASIRAFGPMGSVTVPYDYAATDPHEVAVRALLGYDLAAWGDSVARVGQTRSGRGYVFALVTLAREVSA